VAEGLKAFPRPLGERVGVRERATIELLRQKREGALHINFSSMEVKGMITRREFLKGAMGAATLVGLGSGISQAAPAMESKIVKPERGCFLGFYRTYSMNRGNSPAERVQVYTQYYQEKLGFNPRILMLYEGAELERYPLRESEVLAKKGIVPLIYLKTWGVRKPDNVRVTSMEDVARLPQFKYSVDDIVSGSVDGLLEARARDAAESGRKNGGFFVTTMQEVNNRYWDYYAHPKFKQAWQRMWTKFEEAGANKWVTWVWLVASPYAAPSAHTDPEPLYPGDQYVDWIGMSAHNRLNTGPIAQSQHLSFSDMVNPFADYLKRLHPEKPLMQAEFGKVNMRDQAKYLEDAYRVVKSRGDIHAAIYLDSKAMTNDDWDLNNDSLRMLREVLKDDYWIKAK
jgi:hypothetical protein